MKLPKNISEEQFIKTFDQVVRKLTTLFKFGINEQEDIYQEAFIIAMEGMQRYDASKPLANFLYIHIHNRLCNYKRKHYIRKEPPCTRCPFKAFIKPDKCKIYKDMMDCELYERWHKRNIIKRNLSNTLEYHQVKYHDNTENNMKYISNMGDIIDHKEIHKILDKKIPAKLRKPYTMLINNIKLSKKDEEALKIEIIKILRENGYKI